MHQCKETFHITQHRITDYTMTVITDYFLVIYLNELYMYQDVQRNKDYTKEYKDYPHKPT